MPKSAQRHSVGVGVTIYKKARSPNWWADVHSDGKRIRRSTGMRARRDAEKRAREIYAELIAELAEAAETQADRAERRRDDLAALGGIDIAEAEARGVTGQQVGSITLCWRHICRILGPTTCPRTLSYDTIVGYVARRRRETCRGQPTRGQTIVKELQALKRGLAIAKRRGSVDSVLEDWPKVRHDPPRREQAGKLHDSGVIRAWLRELHRTAPAAARQCEVVLRTGLRATEVRRLAWSWVERSPEGSAVPAILRIPAAAAKGRRERVVGLTAETLVLLDEARAEVRGWDVPIMSGDHKRMMRKAVKAIGYQRTVHLRDLRHCHATWAAQGTGDAAAAQAALGHSDLRTTQRYLTATVDRVTAAATAVAAHIADDRHPGASPSVRHPQEPKDPAFTKVKTGPVESSNGGKRTRTADPLRAKQVLSQLSYAPGRGGSGAGVT